MLYMVYLSFFFFLLALEATFGVVLTGAFCLLIFTFLLILRGPDYFSFFIFQDWVGLMFSILTVYLTALVFLTSLRSSLDKSSSLYLVLFLLLAGFMFFCFSVSSMLFFFFLFEASVLPIFFLILGWGYKMERIQAGFYLFLYTFVFSLFFLLFLFSLMRWLSSFDFFSLIFIYTGFEEMVTGVCCVMFFLVKLPCYFVHLWLPKAHVEATVGGSMILAGVMLKLGGYGLLRFSVFFENLSFLVIFMIFLGVLGGVYAGFNCLRQVDLKCLIAYMSVAHMGLLMGAYCTFGNFGALGMTMMMFCHGLSSSGLFYLIGLVYERFGTRSFFILKASAAFVGGIFIFLFLLLFCNMSCPPTFNFFSELFLAWSLLGEDFLLFFFPFSLMVVLGCVTSIHLFSGLLHGVGKSWFYLLSITVREYCVFLLHLSPLFVIVLFL